MVNFIEQQDEFLIPPPLLKQTRFVENPFDDGSLKMEPTGSGTFILTDIELDSMKKYRGLEYPQEFIDMIDKRSIKSEPMVYKSETVTTNEEEPKVETILGNDLTTSQKWAWVIGLTFAAWALIYWTNKKAE